MKGRIVTLSGVAALLAAVIALTASAAAERAPQAGTGGGFLGSAQLRNALTVPGINRHLRRFQSIADTHDGTRAAGFGGFNSSTRYVTRVLRRAGWEVTQQSFDFDFFFEDAPTVFRQLAPEPQTYVEDVDYATTEFSGSGTARGDLIAVDLTIPATPEPSSTSGCEAADFNGLQIAGQIALIQRGTCTFRDKVENATDAGAAGVVLFNEGQPGRTDVINGTLGGPNAKIPVDHELRARHRAAPKPTPAGGCRSRPRPTRRSARRTNVIAETPTGRPDQRRHGRRAPRLRRRGPGHQRQRLRLRGRPRDRDADRRARDQADQQAPLRLVGRRGGGPRRLGVLRRRPRRRRRSRRSRCT